MHPRKLNGFMENNNRSHGLIFSLTPYNRQTYIQTARSAPTVPFATFMRFSAIEPEASTAKINSDPALRAINLPRRSLLSR